MYLGNKTKNLSTSCYHSVFCVRRLFLVLIYAAFRTRDVGHVVMICSFLVVQSVYVLYTSCFLPHIENVFNYLELASEIGLILLAYTGLVYAISLETQTAQWTLGYVSIGITILIVLVNVSAMILFAVRKIKLYCKKQKAAKMAKEMTDEGFGSPTLEMQLMKKDKVIEEENVLLEGLN